MTFLKRLLPEPPLENPAKHAKVIGRIQGALGLDLRHPKYKPDPAEYKAATLEHCYIATEAAYYLFAMDDGFVPHCRKNDDGTTHWWLQHQETGEILDPTLPQHGGRRYPYEEGRRRPFLPQSPSRRAVELMRRVQAAQAGWKQELAEDTEQGT